MRPLTSKLKLRSLMLAVVLASGAALPAAALTVTFSSNSLSVSGVTPSARVFVCGYGTATGSSSVQSWSRQATIVRSTAGGTADVSIDTPPLDLCSIWLIVDLSSGAYLVTAPPGGHPRQMTVAPLVSADLRGVAFRHPAIDAMIVRPPLGAWSASAVDGRTSDTDGHNDGRTTLGLGTLTPIGDTPHGPNALVPGDLVFAVYQPWMEYAVVQIPPGGPGAH